MDNLRFKKVRDVTSPSRGHATDAGIDMYVPNSVDWDSYTIQPGTDIRIPSGIKFDIEPGWCATFLNKSGISYNKKLIIGGQLIDSGYQGEVHLHLINTSNSEIVIKSGQKIAQIIILPVPEVKITEVKGELYEQTSSRAASGFGSTD